MKTKTVFQTDHSGVFVGATLADESPLEPGVFHIPGGCVEVKPPKHSSLELARWIDGSWVIEQIPTTPEEEERPVTREEVEMSRKRAYADPLTGCDAMFAESSRMDVMGEPGFEEVRTRAIARFEEIQAQYPWPAK